MSEIIIEKSYKSALQFGKQHDDFRRKFLSHMRQLVKLDNELHPKLKDTAMSIHNLVTNETTPYEIKYVTNPTTKQLEIAIISESIRGFNDPVDIVRNPETGDTEHIVAVHDLNVPPIECPNCKTIRKGRTTITTETYALMYCADCMKYTWKKHLHRMSF